MLRSFRPALRAATAALIAGAAVAGVPAQAQDAPAMHDVSVQDIENGYKRHGALTQLHRWYLLYEEPRYGVENALDSLDPDVKVVSGLGEANGHEEYSARVQQLPAEWKNAHDVHDAKVEIAEDGSISLTANITYQNQGLLPDGAVRTADLTYRTSLVR